MSSNILDKWSDPIKRKEARDYIEKRIAEIKQDKELFNKTEVIKCDIELKGQALVQYKFIEIIFRELLEHDASELVEYLIYKGIEHEMVKLGIARQALLNNIAEMTGTDLPESDQIIK